jgi:hypothetical protein
MHWKYTKQSADKKKHIGLPNLGHNPTSEMAHQAQGPSLSAIQCNRTTVIEPRQIKSAPWSNPIPSPHSPRPDHFGPCEKTTTGGWPPLDPCRCGGYSRQESMRWTVSCMLFHRARLPASFSCRVARWRSAQEDRRPFEWSFHDDGDGGTVASDTRARSVPHSLSVRALLRREGTEARDRRPHRSVSAPVGPEGRDNDPAA